MSHYLDALPKADDPEVVREAIHSLKYREGEVPTSVAHAMFLAQSRQSALEELILGLMRRAFEGRIDDVKSVDEYDYSIEFWVKKGAELSTEEQQVLWSLGFSRCWTCVKDGTKEDERYYYAPTSSRRSG